MTARHSPGPWTADGHNILDASGRTIAGAMVSKADACLMAASQDLRDALQGFLALDPSFTAASDAHVAQIAALDGKRGLMARAVQSARAAMAKAAGSTS